MPKEAVVVRKNTCLEMPILNPFQDCVADQHAALYYTDDLLNPVTVQMNGTGESGFYLVDQHPTVYRRNYLKISVGLQLSSGARDQEMVVIDESGTAKKITSFQAIATSLDETEVLKQYGPKRDKGDVSFLQRQYTIPQDLHNSRVSYHRIQFKTAGKNSGSGAHKMAITKARIRFELYAQVENDNEVLVSSLSSQVIVLRGRSQKFYDDLNDNLRREVAQMLASPFNPRFPVKSSTTPVITTSLFGDFQRSQMYTNQNGLPHLDIKGMSKFQTNNGYPGSYDSAIHGFASPPDYFDSPAGSLILSPSGSMMSPDSTTMGQFSPFAFDMTSSNAPQESFQVHPQPSSNSQRPATSASNGDGSQFRDPLEISPDNVLHDFFGPETNQSISQPFFGTPATSSASSPNPSALTSSSAAFKGFSRPNSAPLLPQYMKSYPKSLLKIDTRLGSQPRYASPLSAQAAFSHAGMELDENRGQSAPPTAPEAFGFSGGIDCRSPLDQLFP